MSLFRKKRIQMPSEMENTAGQSIPETKKGQDPQELPQQRLLQETEQSVTPAPRKKKNLADFIVDHNRVIAGIVIVLVVFCLYISQFVKINYDLTTYLPDYAPSKIAIDKMRDTFG